MRHERVNVTILRDASPRALRRNLWMFSKFNNFLSKCKAERPRFRPRLTPCRHLPFEDIGFAKVDHHRAVRHGMPEVILGQGKTPDQVAGIAEALLAKSPNLLLTRATKEMAERVP